MQVNNLKKLAKHYQINLLMLVHRLWDLKIELILLIKIKNIEKNH